MSVDEQRAAGLEDAIGFGEHAAQRLGREVLEHVQRPRLVERIVGKRQAPQIAEEERHSLPRFRREERTDVDADGLGAEVAVPHERPPAAAAEIDDEIARRELQELAQHVVADLRSEERRRDSLVARVGMQRFVEILRLLGELVRGPQIQILVLRRAIRAARMTGRRDRHPPRRERACRGNQDSGRARPADRKSSSREHL